jgi:hypothetical protein
MSKDISNRGKKWTDEEEKTLLDELGKNMDIKLIATAHKRTVNAINERRKQIAYKMYKNNITFNKIMNKTNLSMEEIEKHVNTCQRINIYILKLENNKYYIGRTNNPKFRIENHFNNKGSYWTKKYKPINVIEVINNCDEYDEDKYTIKYMNLYGID